MHRSYKYIATIIILLMLSGCSTTSWPQEKEELNKLNEIIEYKLVNTIGGSLGLDQPTSIVWNNEQLYISDTSNDRIVVTDEEGSLIRYIGQTGNGPLEFIKPTGLAVDAAQNIYVVDSGNNRVQILNKNGKFLEAFSIADYPYMAGVSRLMDIALKDNLIYVTSRTMYQDSAKIFIIDTDDGTVNSIGKSLVGQVANIEDEILFVSFGEIFETKEELSLESGRNYMVNIEGHNLGEVFELPYKYTPGDIQSNSKMIYLLSRTFGTIDRFDHEGNYISTSYRFKLDMDEMLGLEAFTMSDRDLYVLNSQNNLIYLLNKELYSNEP